MSRVRDALGERVHPAHRLDRGTSGVVIFARDKDTLRQLNESWSAVGKHYLALVRGRPTAQGTIDHPVRKGEHGPDRVPAVTRFVLRGTSALARCSLVEAMPQTGRLHQIRRHFKHVSHPLIGDVRYGKGAINRAYRAEWNLHRLALHAWRVSLVHPVTGEALELTAPLPDDLAHPLEALGLGITSQTGRASSTPRQPLP
jgi:tRNA pseudouridine65 synthase